ncbi:transcriptional regulatory protein whiB-like [Mycobacterium tuberculosis variant bovis BCG]|nr:UBA/THIF-type NAD/FAD binding protein [Mycobacterium tuberculosis RGTB327]AKO26277.1 transcriptional regulatory protein whiB-like [Mycobacterium tuberculosis variant bovis BCG]AKO26413.1 transcriptional regulatory protein whiB-like [Mycobacterium tuberculosis variant bovis BCG]KAF3418227.1 hypothetical protein BIS44_3947 [Mycobacterium tuberculosis variant bovis BCG]BAQ07375.1 UBA/THIF-type NAD/FAD binding protein [Mycobacterium tuberculosis str. Kurono]
MVEYLTTPNAPGFSPLKRRGQALPPDRAAHTQCLGYLETGRGIGEPQIGITDVARQNRQSLSGGLSGDCQYRHVLFHLLPGLVAVLRK